MKTKIFEIVDGSLKLAGKNDALWRKIIKMGFTPQAIVIWDADKNENLSYSYADVFFTSGKNTLRVEFNAMGYEY